MAEAILNTDLNTWHLQDDKRLLQDSLAFLFQITYHYSLFELKNGARAAKTEFTKKGQGQ